MHILPKLATSRLRKARNVLVNKAILHRAHLEYWTALTLGAELDDLVSKLVPPKHLRSTWWGDLSRVELQTKHKWKRREGTTLCVGGEWDIHDVRPRISVFDSFDSEDDVWRSDYETIRILFGEGGDYRQTPQFAVLTNKILNGKKTPRGQSLEDIAQYFHQLRSTFDSMKRDGFLTQAQLGKPKRDEIRLHVTRNGQLCYGGMGCHRIAMAEIIGIRWVPFLLESIHPAWVRHISRELGMPPHKAVVEWMENDSRLRNTP